MLYCWLRLLELGGAVVVTHVVLGVAALVGRGNAGVESLWESVEKFTESSSSGTSLLLSSPCKVPPKLLFAAIVTDVQVAEVLVALCD